VLFSVCTCRKGFSGIPHSLATTVGMTLDQLVIKERVERLRHYGLDVDVILKGLRREYPPPVERIDENIAYITKDLKLDIKIFEKKPPSLRLFHRRQPQTKSSIHYRRTRIKHQSIRKTTRTLQLQHRKQSQTKSQIHHPNTGLGQESTRKSTRHLEPIHQPLTRKSKLHHTNTRTKHQSIRKTTNTLQLQHRKQAQTKSSIHYRRTRTKQKSPRKSTQHLEPIHTTLTRKSILHHTNTRTQQERLRKTATTLRTFHRRQPQTYCSFLQESWYYVRKYRGRPKASRVFTQKTPITSRSILREKRRNGVQARICRVHRQTILQVRR